MVQRPDPTRVIREGREGDGGWDRLGVAIAVAAVALPVVLVVVAWLVPFR